MRFQEAAELLRSQQQLRLDSGVVLAVPVPEALAAEARQVEEATRRAVEESIAKGVKGNEAERREELYKII